MNFAIERMMGDTYVSLKGSDHRDGLDHQIALASAISATGRHDPLEIEAFCKALRGLASTSYTSLVQALPKMPLPSGYRHFRLFAAETGEIWNTAFVYEDRRLLTLHDVLFGALNQPLLEMASWTFTEWLPDQLPGVLDLELTFETKPRMAPFRLRP